MVIIKSFQILAILEYMLIVWKKKEYIYLKFFITSYLQKRTRNREKAINIFMDFPSGSV